MIRQQLIDRLDRGGERLTDNEAVPASDGFAYDGRSGSLPALAVRGVSTSKSMCSSIAAPQKFTASPTRNANMPSEHSIS